jgi:hypothetical protein
LFTRLGSKIGVDFSTQNTILRRFYACIRQMSPIWTPSTLRNNLANGFEH